MQRIACFPPWYFPQGSACTKLDEAKRRIGEGVSPAREKARARKRTAAAGTFGKWASLWLSKHVMAESTRDMRRSVYERELLFRYASLKMWEITEEDLRSLCDRIVERGAPATAVHAREIVLTVFRFASERGNKDPNPAELVRPHTIAVFQPRDRRCPLPTSAACTSTSITLRRRPSSASPSSSCC